jgi:hypothetical protein
MPCPAAAAAAAVSATAWLCCPQVRGSSSPLDELAFITQHSDSSALVLQVQAAHSHGGWLACLYVLHLGVQCDVVGGDLGHLQAMPCTAYWGLGMPCTKSDVQLQHAA